MNRPIRAGGVALCLAWFAAFAEPTDDAEQRGRIVAERAQAAVALAEQQQACRARFVVSACLDAARKEHGATLARLRHDEVQLDEAQRRAGAEARNAAVREKAAAQETRASEAASAPPREAQRQPRQPKPALPPAAASKGVRATPSSAALRLAQQRNEAKYEARLREVQAHREAVERRNAERAAQGKVAAPLPVPAGASAP